MIKAGIVGGSGYTAGELLRLLVHHPEVELDFVYSTTNAGNLISEVHQDLLGETNLLFSDSVNTEVDVLFLCLGHGNSKAFIADYKWSANTKIIDLSNDFRLDADAVFEGKNFVYGLPELQKKDIEQSQYLANPGCFATAIQLALLPLAKAEKIVSPIHVNATTGATGAGVKPSATSHFPWRDNNFSVYKAFTHQHLGEINESLSQLQQSYAKEIFFIPNRGNFSRGIFASVYTAFEGTLEEAVELFETYYKDHPFVHISKKPVHLKQVVNTNKCIISLIKHEGQLLVNSAIDNLLKGASGQAVQNMNLMYGFEEATGLNLKANAF